MGKKLTIRLSQQSINEAIREVREYEQEVQQKCETLVKRVSELGLEVASARFTAAVYAGTNDVTVEVNANGTKATILASGEAVGFIEFGTGVYNPDYPEDAAYQPPPHGSYGKGMGKRKAWGYYGDPGNGGTVKRTKGDQTLVITHGNEPAMAMYGAVTEMAGAIAEIAREVFK